MIRSGRGALAGAFVVVALLGVTVWLQARPVVVQQAWPPLVYGECQAGQARVMILGTFHFAQQDAIDVLAPDRQRELESLAAGVARFAPTHVAVEHPYARSDTLHAAYERYLGDGGVSGSRNEIVQLGFRLARSLGHERVHAVDVEMKLWHDSIQVFDDEFPGSRGRLRREWKVRYPDTPDVDAGATLASILAAANRDDPPANSEMYANFLPLVEDEVYAGALKLRPWYDRNLRIVQNFFRILEDGNDRLVFVGGFGHLRVLKQILDLTPQLCAVDAVPYLD